MAGQNENSEFSRLFMSLLRCCWSGLYLWVMMHAATVVLIAEERWNTGFLWNTRLPDKLVYYDALYTDPFGEHLILTMISAVLTSIYAAFGCRLGGSQSPQRTGYKPELNKIFMCIPYLAAFLSCCIFSTYFLVRQIFMREPGNTSLNLYAQLIVVLLLKILAMANMTSACLRAYVKLLDVMAEWNRGHVSSLNFGELLDLFFCN